MARLEILNLADEPMPAAAPESDPVALSQAILSEARRLVKPGECARLAELAARYLPELAARFRDRRRGLRVGYRRFDWTAAGG